MIDRTLRYVFSLSLFVVYLVFLSPSFSFLPPALVLPHLALVFLNPISVDYPARHVSGSLGILPLPSCTYGPSEWWISSFFVVVVVFFPWQKTTHLWSKSGSRDALEPFSSWAFDQWMFSFLFFSFIFLKACVRNHLKTCPRRCIEDEEVKISHCQESRAIDGYLFKAWGRSDHSHACFACCLDLF